MIQHELFQIFPEAYPILARYEYDESGQAPTEGICHMARTHLIHDLSFAYIDVNSATAAAFSAYSVALLIDYLKRSHRYYTRRALPEIGQTLSEVVRHVPEVHPLGKYGNQLYRKFCDDCIAHFAYEEENLFAYAEELEKRWRNGVQTGQVAIEYSAARFVDEHPDTELDLDKFVQFLGRLSGSHSADFALSILRKQLSNLHADMKLHSLIEDRVLVPRLMELEARCISQG